MNTTENLAPVTDATTDPCATRRPSRRRARATTVAVATVVATATWALQHLVLGVDLQLAGRDGQAPQTVGVASVIATALVSGLLGWAALALLERFTARARTLWTVLAVVVLLVSLVGPLGAATASATAGLLALHLAVGVCLVVSMRRTCR
ncbi:hypothetical protein GCM10027446_22000 [Angustibacter peucedani]